MSGRTQSRWARQSSSGRINTSLPVGEKDSAKPDQLIERPEGVLEHVARYDQVNRIAIDIRGRLVDREAAFVGFLSGSGVHLYAELETVGEEIKQCSVCATEIEDPVVGLRMRQNSLQRERCVEPVGSPQSLVVGPALVAQVVLAGLDHRVTRGGPSLRSVYASQAFIVMSA